MREVGKAAGELFDATARDDQHGYFGRSLREVGHGICRAAPGAPPPLKTPKCGGWDRPGFFLGGSCYTLVMGDVNYLTLNLSIKF